MKIQRLIAAIALIGTGLVVLPQASSAGGHDCEISFDSTSNGFDPCQCLPINNGFDQCQCLPIKIVPAFNLYVDGKYDPCPDPVIIIPTTTTVAPTTTEAPATTAAPTTAAPDTTAAAGDSGAAAPELPATGNGNSSTMAMLAALMVGLGVAALAATRRRQLN